MIDSNQIDPIMLYKCLADETRLKCLLLICHQTELCVCELMTALNLSQPKVSRHLAQLRQHGLVSGKRQGQWVFYSISSQLNDWAKNIILLTLQHNQVMIKPDLKRLAAMGERPIRQQQCC
ncbi:metalloregulator ArsR/SmtB family transcription factor [Aliikangiella sp. IMCC44653]